MAPARDEGLEGRRRLRREDRDENRVERESRAASRARAGALCFERLQGRCSERHCFLLVPVPGLVRKNADPEPPGRRGSRPSAAQRRRIGGVLAGDRVEHGFEVLGRARERADLVEREAERHRAMPAHAPVRGPQARDAAVGGRAHDRAPRLRAEREGHEAGARRRPPSRWRSRPSSASGSRGSSRAPARRRTRTGTPRRPRARPSRAWRRGSAPASASRAIAVASAVGTRSLKRGEPHVVATPFVSRRSFAAYGMPCSGWRGMPDFRSASARRAAGERALLHQRRDGVEGGTDSCEGGKGKSSSARRMMSFPPPARELGDARRDRTPEREPSLPPSKKSSPAHRSPSGQEDRRRVGLVRQRRRAARPRAPSAGRARRASRRAAARR